MTVYDADITAAFRVEVDETKFTEAFFEEFSSYMFYVDCVEDCVKHLADLFARGVIDAQTTELEGYGKLADFGVKFITERGVSAFIDLPVKVEVAVAVL